MKKIEIDEKKTMKNNTLLKKIEIVEIKNHTDSKKKVKKKNTAKQIQIMEKNMQIVEKIYSGKKGYSEKQIVEKITYWKKIYRQ